MEGPDWTGSVAGKTMIVQILNIGGDVGGNQIDLLIPGGGVGAFNACSNQWGTSDLGAQYDANADSISPHDSLGPRRMGL